MATVVDTIISTVIEQLHQSSRVVVGVSGPQGSGKTTATKQAAEQLINKHNIPVLAVSLDDFYKPFTELQSIAKRGNPLLSHRGLPGTHDVGLANQFLRDFKSQSHTNLKIPVYGKSLHSGAGDRTGFVDVPKNTVAILLEGWMVGFQPVGNPLVEHLAVRLAGEHLSVRPTVVDLLEIEQNLQQYTSIWKTFDAFIRLVPEKLDYIYHWRLHQEQELRHSRGTGMTDAQVKQFVDQYMPCYFIYNRTLPDASHAIVFSLNKDHKATRQVSTPASPQLL